MTKPLAIAHRGASGRELENSLAAFRLARTLGADAVEFDVHGTSDGALVVHHDDAIGRRPIGDLSLAEVRARTLSNGERVPTLEAALQVILPDLYAYVEIKTLDGRWDQQLLATFDASPAPDRIAIHSFDHRIIRRLAEVRPSLPRGVLLSAYLVDLPHVLEAAQAGTVWQRWDTIDAGLVARARGANAEVIAWTVDEPAEMTRLLQLGVRGLCTNHPERARHAIDSSS